MAPTQPGGTTPTPSEPLSPAALAPHFPQLEILECLGRGGMGVVYKARQKALNRFVALKILAPERSTDPGFAERFTAEARTLASLNHPNIVTIHDFGESGGFYHLVMEYVDGVNLRQAMTAGRFTPEQALAIVPPVCEALQYAHDHGVVHRDIKPENLLLDQQGRVKVADFGIAKLLGSATAGGPDAAAADTVPADAPPAGAGGPDTLGASAAGTPQYMAPEQRARGPVDHRADIYSLGVVLYELLTGELPGHSLKNPSRRIQIDVRLDEVVLRALAVTPELRFPTATEFRTRVEALTAPATPAPIQPPPIQVNASALYRSLVPWALTYQWMVASILALAGINEAVRAWMGWMEGIPLGIAVFPIVYGTLRLDSLARRKADQWLNSLETGGAPSTEPTGCAVLPAPGRGRLDGCPPGLRTGLIDSIWLGVYSLRVGRLSLGAAHAGERPKTQPVAAEAIDDVLRHPGGLAGRGGDRQPRRRHPEAFDPTDLQGSPSGTGRAGHMASGGAGPDPWASAGSMVPGIPGAANPSGHASGRRIRPVGLQGRRSQRVHQLRGHDRSLLRDQNTVSARGILGGLDATI